MRNFLGLCPMSRFRILATLGGLFCLLLLFTFMLYRSVVNLSGEYIDNRTVSIDIQNFSEYPTKYFGVVSRYPAHIIYQQYQPLMDYLNRNTDYHFQLKLSNSYSETVQQLASGEVDVALLGSYMYATSKDEHDLIAILKPLNEDSLALRRSVLFTSKNSIIHKTDDLRGKKLALASKESFSGNWMPLHMLRLNGITRDDLEDISNYPNHHTVIHKVLRGEYDAGAVRESVARDFMDRGLRIFEYSDPLPTSPIVVTKQQDPDMVAAIINALVHQDPARTDKAGPIDIMDGGTVVSYIETDGSEYNFIRRVTNE
ncbi:MAG: hypothetical protein EA363_12165 [Balneolaceae bacterium]|nr:MAG: hypothetical protein EA363_12165 [Balneolaceae bacterium]